jgi:CBS domain-containing protein
MKARELMVRCPDVILPDDSIAAAAELMHYANDAFVPVVRDRESLILVGVITARDIVVRCVARHHPLTCRVRDHMTPTPLHTLSPDDDVVDAARYMSDWEVRRIPVVTADGVLRGVIHEPDLRRALTGLAPLGGHESPHRAHPTLDNRPPLSVSSPDSPVSDGPPFARR